MQIVKERMMKRWWMVWMVGVIFLSGCGAVASGANDAGGAAPALAQEDAGSVIAEGVIEPVRWEEVLLVQGGAVAEVFVVEGATVAQGEVLMRLAEAEAALAVQEARAGLAEAEADLAQVKAGPQPGEIAEAEAQIEAAQARLAQAMARRDELAGGTTAADVAAAQAQVEAAEAEHLNARIERDRIHDQSGDDKERENADYRLYAAREALAAAQATLKAQRQMTQGRLREARSAVWSASAQEQIARAQLAQVKADSRLEEIEIKQTLVRQAEVAVAQAELALARTEVRAPFTGTVTRIAVEVGERVNPGQPVVVLATLDRLRVRTTDLTELDVARIAEGQPVAVTVDALPDLTLEGYVQRIRGRSVEMHGDVTYPVYVALEERGPALRWGMTTVVEIEPIE